MSSPSNGSDADLWHLADALFADALDLEPGERDRFLSDADASERVIARVRRLLDLDTEARGFLEGEGALELTLAADALSSAASAVRNDLAVGTRIGRYRVTGVLGRGGTSTVYRAERADGTFEQDVAIKVVRADVHPEALARRMRAERQILASLSHPNLARVFDGGVTDDGRPWLGVELIEGTRIDRWADERRLTVEARVRLFLQVLAAVQHAHRNLVVHRDLKPSNILVTQDGVAKLLDFGVAKLLQPDDADARLEDTRPAEGRWLTPAYAAPEQILGEPVTTATDIHALGVVLYELLAGQRPFLGQGDASYPLERAICETEPTSPSTAVRRPHDDSTDASTIARARSATEAELRRSLGGDLDAIILRALRKNPEHRYASAEAMADDLSRHLEGLPVSARGDATAYRIGTFARRHMVPVAAAALLFLTVTGSAISLALSRGALVEARAAAEAEAEQSAAAVAFLADVFRGSDPDVAPSDTVTAAELVAWGEERVTAEYGDRPEVQARLLTLLGDAWGNLGLADRGLALHERSLAIRREVHGDESPEVVDGLLTISQNRRMVRDPRSAGPRVVEAIDVARRIYPAGDLAMVVPLVEMGHVLTLAAEGDSALPYFEEARRIWVANGLEDTPEHLNLLLALGPAQRSAGDLEGAAATYREILPRFRRAFPDDRSELAVHVNNAAFVARLQEDLQAADTLYREALELTRGVYGRGHPNTSVVTNNLVQVLLRLGRSTEALELLERLLPDVEELFGTDHWRVGGVWTLVSKVHGERGDLPEALSAQERTLAIDEAALGADHYWTVFDRAEVEALRRALDLTEDTAAYERVLAMAESWYTEGRGRIYPDGVGQIKGLVATLRSAGQDSLAARFTALLPDDGN